MHNESIVPLVAVTFNQIHLSAGIVESAKAVMVLPEVTSVVVAVTMDVPEAVLDVPWIRFQVALGNVPVSTHLILPMVMASSTKNIVVDSPDPGFLIVKALIRLGEMDDPEIVMVVAVRDVTTATPIVAWVVMFIVGKVPIPIPVR